MHSSPMPLEKTPRAELQNLPAPAGRIVILTLLGLAAGSLLTYGLAQAEYETLTGYLQAKGKTIRAGRDARIANILVRQGTVAEVGTPLVVLGDVELDGLRETARRDVAALEAELAQVHARAAIELANRRQSLEAEIFETKLKSAQFLKQQYSQKSDTLARGLSNGDEEWVLPRRVAPAVLETRDGDFATSGLSNPSDHGDRAADLQALEVSAAQVKLCEERLVELENRLNELPEQILEAFGAKVVAARLEQARDELTRLEQQQQSLTLVAEVHGTVGVFLAGVGDRVAPNDPIVELLDEDQPYLLLQVPSQRVADFQPGTELELRFPGGIRGRGRVYDIPPQIAPLPRPNARIDEDAALLSVFVTPSGRVWPKIPFGSAVEVRHARK